MIRAQVLERLRAERAAAADCQAFQYAAELDRRIADIEASSSPVNPARETTAARRPKTTSKTTRRNHVVRD